MASRPGSRADHNKFCEREGWTLVRNARGKQVRHHVTWELLLPSGAVLRTRISRPVNSDTYGPTLWSTILDDQLKVTEEEFWACVDNGTLSHREPPAPPPAEGLPLSLVRQLQRDLHLTDSQIAQLSREEAVRLMTAHWSQPPS